MPVASELLVGERAGNNRHPEGKSGNSWSPACRLTKWEIKQRHEPGITGSDEPSLAESRTEKMQQAPSDRHGANVSTRERHRRSRVDYKVTDGRVCSRSSRAAGGRAEEEERAGEVFLLASFQQQNRFLPSA